MANEMYTTPETNVITKNQMAKVREVDFVSQFTHNSIAKFMEVLGVSRRIPMQEGTTMYVYTTTGALDAGGGAVAEGAVIPLSQYATAKTAVGNIALKKFRKAVTAEAILKSGFNAAVIDTDNALLRDVQKAVRSNLFSFLNGTISGSVTAAGTGLQAALADGWGKLQIAFEDDTAEAVFFLNPEDVSAYLGTAQVTMQTAFGMNYIENFLGLGTVIMNSQVAKGTYVATAKQNLMCYYIPMNGDIANAFDLTSDDTGLVGIKSGYQTEERAQIESLVLSGVQFLVEYAGGVVKGTINP